MMTLWVILHHWEEQINGGEYSTWHNDEYVQVVASQQEAETFVKSKPYKDTDHYTYQSVDVDGVI